MTVVAGERFSHYYPTPAHPAAVGVINVYARVGRGYYGWLEDQNKFGGHPLPALFTPTIRVPLRATQAESKRGNTNQ